MDDPKFGILYVDDEEQNLISFKASFRRSYDVHTARSGKEGLDLLRKHDHIGLVITDQRMPEMTGIEFLERILPEYPDTIRIILTGFSDVEAIIGAINNGRVFRYITKPWDERELRMTIENARQLHELGRQNRRLVDELQLKVQEQERILRLFTRYVPEPVVEQALSQSEDTMLEGIQLQITVLFCDLRGFTPMSERLSPREVVAFLNDYYRIMSRRIKRHNGVVNQFVGDEIFATFGAPIAYPDNEANAVFCALEMMHGLGELNDLYREKIGDSMQMGIGINSGEVVAGNLGSEDRIDYSVTGDTVNTGKRIEMLTKETPNRILISDSVYEVVRSMVEVRSWDPVHVKGKHEPILVHEVLGRA